MSWHIDTPGVPAGDADRKIDHLFRYLYRIAGQINYALGFLPLPGLTQTGTEQPEADARIAEIGEKSTNAQIPSAGAVFRFVKGYAVPKERTVNGYALTDDVQLVASDVAAVSTQSIVTDISAESTDEEIPTAAAVKAFAESAAKILETGADGPWKWYKISDGTAILYGHAVPTTISEPSEWITDWSEGIVSVTLPQLFSDAAFTGTAMGDTSAIVSGGRNVSSSLYTLKIISPASLYPTSMTIDAVFFGRWRQEGI